MNQLSLPLGSSAPTDGQLLAVGGRTYRVRIARHRRARRYVLRLAPDQTLRLTVPRGASIAAGLRFAARQAAWIERERCRQEQRLVPWRDGTTVWFQGERVTLDIAGTTVMCGGARVVLRAGADVRTALEAHFQALAADSLPPRCLELAARHGLTVARVSTRNQRSRWGACSARGVITLNWRLVQMPPFVSDYVVLHELMHLRQPNHSRRFWREVASVCPDWRDAERWLRRHGKEIL